MRIVLHVAIVLLLATVVVQAQSHQAKEETTKQEIQKLFSDLNEAITKRDRPRLEQLYADEFQFIRPSGGVISKTIQMMFVKNENGQVTGVVLRLGSCQDTKAKKIE